LDSGAVSSCSSVSGEALDEKDLDVSIRLVQVAVEHS